MKVATTAETKCSTIWHVASSQHLPLEEQLALHLNVVYRGGRHQHFRNDETEDNKDKRPLPQNVCGYKLNPPVILPKNFKQESAPNMLDIF